MLDALVSSGRAVDIVLAVLIVEALVLLVYRRLTGRGIATAQLLTAVGAGACLALALRISLTDGGSLAIAMLLAVGGLFHLADLVQRWQR